MYASLRYDDKNITALYKAAHANDVLVPIRLDIDFDGQKLRDTFTWNKHGENAGSQSYIDVPAMLQ